MQNEVTPVAQIDPNDKAFFPWRENFIVVSAQCRCKNIEEAYNRDIELSKAYVGRELLEMMQNADDQKSSMLEIRLDSATKCLSIVNSGDDTIPFSKEGFECLIRANTSEKRVLGNSAIGHKGCGFRSLLNWADEIKIHSNGVVFTFGQEARDAAWKRICETTDAEFEREKSLLLARMQKAHKGCEIPLSIMTTPMVDAEKAEDGPSWTSTDGYITSICIRFDQTKLEEVKRQLEAITPESLLFVRNLKTVNIQEKDTGGTVKERTLSCEIRGNKTLGDNNMCATVLRLRNGAEDTLWYKVIRVEGENEMAVAWHTDRHPVALDHRVVYTYFPTAFQLDWLPCILHATFDLDPSRNGINSTTENINLMRACGRFLSDVASGIAESTDWDSDIDSDEQAWFPYDMLNVGEIAERDLLRCALREGARVGLEKKPICPVTSYGYMRKEDVVCYSAPLAAYLLDEGKTDCFRSHVWRSFERRRFSPVATRSLENDADDFMQKLCPALEEPSCSQDGIDFGKFVSALVILLEIRQRLSWTLQVSCLPDLQLRMIDKRTTGYVNCGEMLEGAADSLGIHYVNPRFVECCREKNLVAKADWDNGRGLVAKLKGICKCSSSDLNPMKDFLVAHSICGYLDSRGDGHTSEDCYNEVIKCLYALYLKRPRAEPMSLYFHVLCEDGNVRQASDACLWDEDGQVGISMLLPNTPIGPKWKMKGSLQYWKRYLGVADSEVDKSNLIDFFRKFLRVSFGFPCTVQYCLQLDSGQYLQAQCETAVADRVMKPRYFEVSNWIPSLSGSFRSCTQLEDNSLYGIDFDFVNSLGKLNGIDLFELIVRDHALCRRIVYQPVVHASYYYDRTCTFKESYLAYTLRKQNWVSDLAPELVDAKIKEWDAASIRWARDVMRALGISQELEDMPVGMIYEKLAACRDPRGIQNIYSRARMVIRKRIKEGVATEEQCANLAREKLSQLFARVRNEQTKRMEVQLVTRENIRYWDNALVSRSLLDSLPKLEIGSRVGASSVEKLFGVYQFKSDDIDVLDSVRASEDKGLSEAVNARLRKLRAYILAARFRDAWNEEVCPEICSEAKKCKSFEVHIVQPIAEAFCLKDHDGNNGGKRYGLSEGDLLQDKSKGIYWICSSWNTIDELWSKSTFRAAVVEAMCIHFQLTIGTQIESAFREVLRNTASENEEMRVRTVSDERWQELLSVLGISDDERAFWKAVALRGGRTLADEDIDALTFEGGEWKTVLKDWFGYNQIPPEIDALEDFAKLKPMGIITLARWCGMSFCELPPLVRSTIKAYIAQSAEEWRGFRAVGAFSRKLHERLVNSKLEEQKTYTTLQHQFMEMPVDDVVDALMSKPEIPTDVAKALNELLIADVEIRFNVKIEELGETTCPDTCTEYQEVLHGRKLGVLPLDEQSLAFFAGHSELLREAFAKQEAKHVPPKVTKVVDGCAPSALVEHILEASELKNESGHYSDSMGSHKTHNAGSDYHTDVEKIAQGESAESVVERMLSQWKKEGKCLQFGARSTISNATGTADDGANFDFWYMTPENEIRLLEVKSYSGFRVIMTKGEYRKATSERWRKKYDLVLVMAGRPYILKGPLFGEDSEFKDSIGIEAATYNLRIELRNVNALREEEINKTI